MHTNTHHLRSSSAAVAFLMLLSGSACYEWHAEGLAPAALIARRQPTVLRVTFTDSSHVILQRPALRGDTLLGIGQDHGGADSMRIPLANIRELATSRVSATRTARGIVGAGA